MHKLSFVYLLFFMTICIYEARSQKFLEYRKNRRYEKIRFYQGDLMQLKLTNGQKINGVIDQIQEKFFLLNGKKIFPDSVKIIIVTKKYSLLNTASKFLMTGGLAYFPMVTLNRSINDDRPVLSETAAVISGGMILGSLLAKYLTKRRFRVKAKRPLKIIDYRP